MKLIKKSGIIAKSINASKVTKWSTYDAHDNWSKTGQLYFRVSGRHSSTLDSLQPFQSRARCISLRPFIPNNLISRTVDPIARKRMSLIEQYAFDKILPAVPQTELLRQYVLYTTEGSEVTIHAYTACWQLKYTWECYKPYTKYIHIASCSRTKCLYA